MISEEEARRRILQNLAPLPERTVPLASALGFFSARQIRARLPLPLFDNSAMDGYAVTAGSCTKGVRLVVIGEQPAGPDRKLQVRAGQAVQIFTGGAMPEGTDAIVMQEDITREENEITLNTDVEPGDFVRQRGCDLAEGQIILDKGEQIRVGTVALLASQGFAHAHVAGEASVAIISTGTELVEPGGNIGPGQIYDSNSALLNGLVARCGARVNSMEHSRDDEQSLGAAIQRAGKNHVLVISGGVSVGKHDVVKEALRQAGAEIAIWRVSIKPGKPFLFGRIGACLVFGLPGNPVSAFVTFLQFVRPAILRLMGATDLDLRRVAAELTCDLTNAGDRPHYIRGRLEDGKFTPIGRQESHALFGLSRSNALFRLAVGESRKAGHFAKVQIWD